MSLVVREVAPWSRTPGEEPTLNPREVELLTTGVVSVSWRSLSDPRPHERHLHLFVGIGNKPPVDLAFDQLTGAMTSAQVVFQDETVLDQKVFDPGEHVPVERGLPRVDLASWPDPTYMVDSHYDPVVGLGPSGTLVVRITDASSLPSRELDLGNLRLVLDAADRILGFRLLDLDQQQIDTVRLAESTP